MNEKITKKTIQKIIDNNLKYYKEKEEICYKCLILLLELEDYQIKKIANRIEQSTLNNQVRKELTDYLNKHKCDIKQVANEINLAPVTLYKYYNYRLELGTKTLEKIQKYIIE